jgi:hypothetical protein
MKKKTIIIVITLLVIVLAVYFYIKSKKKATAPVQSLAGNNVADTISAAVLQKVEKSSITTPTASASIPLTLVQKPTTLNVAPVNSSIPVGGSWTDKTEASIKTAILNGTFAANPAYNFVNVIRDGSQGKATIQFQPVTREFSQGDSVNIPSGPYAGTHKIWYIYKGVQDGAPVHNLYLDTPFITPVGGPKIPGTFYKV